MRKYKAYFKPIEFEAEDLQEANEMVTSGDYQDDIECDVLEEIE